MAIQTKTSEPKSPNNILSLTSKIKYFFINYPLTKSLPIRFCSKNKSFLCSVQFLAQKPELHAYFHTLKSFFSLTPKMFKGIELVHVRFRSVLEFPVCFENF
jgi:hypothetical protein